MHPIAPGYRSTEFWVQNGAAVALIQALTSVENPWVQALCVLGATACVVTYGWRRAEVKCAAFPSCVRCGANK